MPVYDIDAGKLFDTCFSYSMWFGDFTIVYIFMGRVKEDDGKMNFWFPVVLMISGQIARLKTHHELPHMAKVHSKYSKVKRKKQ